ncbi:HK97 gp10 family phage protein [Paenibacillus hamazuiensis]|uniref:HK97 gp10 family phage protein n=1 Tax=Paenibacillus hamazuiensis TaxID=2936508 RepID=UPI00200C6E2B|nr:HK97 gp10 family phage protein [Paenibacillus hamazuiensis]
MSKFGDFEFKDFNALGQKLDNMHAATPRFFEDCLDELASRLRAKVIKKTPKDHSGWTAGPIQRKAGFYTVEIKYQGADFQSLRELENEMAAVVENKANRFIKQHLGW